MARIAAATNKGPYRRTNEDACGIQVASTPLGEAVLAVVCDGVGGMAHGDVASALVVRSFSTWFKNDFSDVVFSMEHGFDGRIVLEAWDRVLAACNQELRSRGMRSNAAMATTFTGVLACGGSYVVGQVGDSRLYIVENIVENDKPSGNEPSGGESSGNEQRCECRQITQDQTLVARMVQRGEITASEALSHPHQNVILQAVGADDDLCPVYSTGSYDDCDVFVLCTDGIYRTLGTQGLARSLAHRWALDDAELQAIRNDTRQATSDKVLQASCCGNLQAAGDELLQAACDDLIERAITAGERDNLTVCCFAFGEKSPTLAGTIVMGES